MKRSFDGEIVTNDGSRGVDVGTSSHKNPAKCLIRSKYADIKIKVDEDVYHLDRLQLASKSDYFEKLFIEDFREKKINFLELPVMDSDTFSTMVDMIYGQDLKSTLNADNYVQLLMAMDYLQMKIDLNVYGKFIEDFIQKRPSLDLNIFKLCQYVAENKNFDDLMPSVYTCMSAHYAEVQDHEEFLSLTLDQVVGFMCGQRIEYSNINDIRQCSQVCVKWIFHDVENRLSHAVKLVNAVKRRLNFPYYINVADLKVKMRDAGKEVTPDSVLKYFIDMVAFQGEIGADNVETPKMRKPCEHQEYKEPSPIDQNERDKMIRFLENGDLHDIVVKVEGETYKLHRCKLLLESGYFANIFSTESSETSSQTNKVEEYLLDVEGVDRKLFDVSIRYIYFRELELNSESVVSVLKTACLLKIDSLLGDCELWIMRNFHKLSSNIVAEILNSIRNADLIVRFEKMYKCLLCRRILSTWSSNDDCSLFCAIPIHMLEEWLITPLLHKKKHDAYSVPENLGLDDSNKLLEICSKWVMEDVQNRYHFIPRIARAINCNLMMDCDDFKMETTSDMSNCSEQLVRVHLMRVLLSTPLVAHDTLLENTPRKNAEKPVFVTSSKTMIRILNAKMNEIVTLRLYKDFKEFKHWQDDHPFHRAVSSTIMGDNLFIAAKIKVSGSFGDFHTRMFFQAYNMSSKKFTSLAYLPEISHHRYVLLNCRNDIYCCFENGLILKYVMHLNRWTQFTKAGESLDRIPLNLEDLNAYPYPLRFASDGKTLYKLYENVIQTRSEVTGYTFTRKKQFFEAYDFDRNIWIPIPDMTIDANQRSAAQNVITMKNGDVAVLFPDTFLIFDRNSRSWHQLPITVRSSSSLGRDECAITQWDDTLLLHYDNKLYYYQLSNSNPSWQVKKQNLYMRDNGERFDSVTSVHRPAN